jgi:hypothetical protein
MRKILNNNQLLFSPATPYTRKKETFHLILENQNERSNIT